VRRLLEASVGSPAVAEQGPVEVGAEDAAGLGVAAAVHDPVDRDRRGDEDPQPLQAPADLPAGLVGGDDGGVLDLLAEGAVGRGEGLGDSVQRLADSPARDVEGEGRAEDRADLAEGCADLLVEVGGEGFGPGTEMDVRRSEGVARLQRVPPLHPSAAARAATHMDPEAADTGRYRREVLLILLHDLGLFHILAAAVRTGFDRRLVALVDVVGDPPPGFDAVGFAGLASRALRVRLR